ncbi:MAG TPA: D-alanine--D-alanine ligase [Candidatus Anaerotruncus excrementipullorum]|uniref:D-alanine--D-alanine ligase n=1 Tax=Candidatus Anaerotruncus excrementipullorum TaxID=2838465 RepID=A0A9D2B7F3_9FIRM|nr:D-alanine--D-alanine ligase [Candidatus Anaerotruncus excrementipullorum]
MQKLTAAILFGSVSSEYEVSLRSAVSVLTHIPREKYDVVMVGITKDGRWYHYEGGLEAIQADRWLQEGPVTPAILSPDRSAGGLTRFTPQGPQNLHIDVVFPVLHGERGEDGTIQGLLEMAGLPYVGCGVLSSAACMDKQVTHLLLEAAGIATAPYRALIRSQLAELDRLEPQLAAELGYPMFVKPANTGSSVGVSKVKSAGELRPALEKAFAYDRKVLVERAIVGHEVECAVLGNYEDAIAATVGEIVPHHEFYDYEGKYLDDSTDLYIPARLPEETIQLVRRTAVKAFAAMECTGLARVDFFVQADGSVLINELNTIPGFTSISMYPKLFEAAGLPYPQLIDRLLTLALERRAR